MYRSTVITRLTHTHSMRPDYPSFPLGGLALSYECKFCYKEFQLSSADAHAKHGDCSLQMSAISTCSLVSLESIHLLMFVSVVF